MTSFVLTPQAGRDLEGIWEYIAEDSIERADRVADEIEAALRLIADNPRIGHIREDFADDRHRFWPVLSYLIMYRHGTRPLQILRIVSGYRDLIALLNPPT